MKRFTKTPIVIVLALAPWLMTPNQGRIEVTPTRGVAGHFGTWVLSYRVGSEGIAQGGGIRVQLPDSWHAGARNSANPLQASNPAGDHYVSAGSSRSDVRLETVVESESDRILVKSSRPGLDGRSERYVFVVRVRLLQGGLREGDTLSVVYGDTSRGSRGMRAAIIATPPEPILVAIDSAGSGQYRLHPDRPSLQSISGPPAELLLTGRSDLVVGRPARLQLAVVDANSNPVHSFQGEVQFQLLQGRAEIPDSLEVSLPQGWTSVPFTPSLEGILRIEASTLGGILRARTNPMKAAAQEPQRKMFWGDLHSHSHYSWDGVGTNPFEYARNIAGLDFYAMTDHSRLPDGAFTRGLGPHVWEEYTALTEKYDAPGQFVTLHAYEASFGAPHGHHNIYFRGKPGPLIAPGRVSLPQLWEQLEAGAALTIPHHTGKFPNPVRWEPHDPDFRRNFEIYSAHGLSESYDPAHPLAFEQSDFTSPGRSAPGRQFAQDAWMQGLELSTVAASDDHRAQPGKPHWGLTAASATALKREDIFDALHQRRTYGTTGARILLDFSINGRRMGEKLSAGGPPQLQIEAHGTDTIDTVEILRYCKADGAFKVIYRLDPEALDFRWSGLDRSFRQDSIYYVRLRQDGQIRNRIAMAWTSPIWVEFVGRGSSD